MSAGVESILKREEGLEVMSFPVSAGNEFLIQIERLHPDVVIWDSSLNPEKILRLLEKNITSCLLEVDINENLIRVYEKREVFIVRPQDLINEIHQKIERVGEGGK